MRRGEFIPVFVGSAMLLTIVAMATTALAQGGSTGGSIGKTNKSMSGEEPGDPPDRKPPAPANQNTSASIAGSWDWEASCSSESWQGGMILRASSSTEFTGEFSKGHSGSLVGTVKGNRVAFVRDWHGIVKQQCTGTLSGPPGAKLRMQGPFTDPNRAGCRFSATKN